jgi:hypothetical protein
MINGKTNEMDERKNEWKRDEKQQKGDAPWPILINWCR